MEALLDETGSARTASRDASLLVLSGNAWGYAVPAAPLVLTTVEK